MKIAMCFSGGIKYPENGVKSLKRIDPNCQIKIFAHTWNVQQKNNFYKSIANTQYKEKSNHINFDFNFLSNYNYHSLLIDSYDYMEKKFKNYFNNINYKKIESPKIGLLSMHYSIWKCNELKKQYEQQNNMTFDFVVRLRYDSEIQVDLDFSEFTKRDIYIPWGDDWRGGINDQFAIGTSKSMDVYSRLYFNIGNYQDPMEYHAETILRHYLNDNGLYPYRKKIPVRINNGNDFRKTFTQEQISEYMRLHSPDYQYYKHEIFE
jgi:hypothetical protein